jgi:hypothetical protein
MNNEKQNNPLAEKLDSMNSLPEGFGFSATRVWDQLENQLQDKNGKPILWLRYAAAIVLLAGAAIFWVFQKEAPITKDASVNQINLQSPIKIKTSTKTKALDVIAKSQITVINKPIFSNKILVSNKIESTIAIVPTTIPIIISPIKDSVQVGETIAATFSNPVIVTKATTKPTVIRKKYPVIHLFDLYSEPDPSYTKSASKKQSNLSTEEPFIYNQEPNRTWWLPKPKTVIITTLTDNQ